MSKEVPITKYTVSTIRYLVVRLKREAMRAGRYEMTSAGLYDKRDKSKAFRCITYNARVREINALSRLLRRYRSSARDVDAAIKAAEGGEASDVE